jgi:hypothetical protein
VRARNEGRDLSLSSLNSTLASVYLPQRLNDERAMQVTRIGPSSRGTQTSRVSVGSDRELALYLTAREAHYARDYDRAARAFSDYLDEFNRGRFADCARAGRAVALLRAGYTDAALDVWQSDVRDNSARSALLDATEQQLFRQGEQERQLRAPKTHTRRRQIAAELSRFNRRLPRQSVGPRAQDVSDEALAKSGVAPLHLFQSRASGPPERLPDPVCERTKMGSGTGNARSQTPFPQSPDVSNGATIYSVS